MSEKRQRSREIDDSVDGEMLQLQKKGKHERTIDIKPEDLLAYVQAWTLHPSAVPPATKKIYGVIRGHCPGLYFDWSVAEPQCRGFSSALFESFPKGKKTLKADNLDQVVCDAISYMNHDSRNCKYSCKGTSKCIQPRRVAQTAAQVEQDVDSPATEKKRPRHSCRACGSLPPLGRRRVCPNCPQMENYLIKVRSCAQKFDLCDEQTALLESIAIGDNVFFTGAAGTGKIRVIEALADLFSSINVASKIVAPTGIAALNVKGMTIHVYAGWTPKLSEASLDELRQVAGERKVYTRFASTDVLIIDEISMIESDTLLRLSSMMRQVLNPDLPFGGVQIVITGDFFQLPPVCPFKTCTACGRGLERSSELPGIATCAKHGNFHDSDKWPFKSALWRECKFKNVQLSKVHRQMDPDFIKILHSVRRGPEWTLEQENLLFNHDHNVTFEDAVKLNPLKKEVDRINEMHMQELSFPIQRYHSVDHSHCEKHHPEYKDTQPLASLAHHRYTDELELKEGMKVLLLTNLDPIGGLVNGSSGEIIGFEKMRYLNDEQPVEHSHREYAQERIREFKYGFEESQLWPIVRFSNGVARTIFAHCCITELGTDKPYSLLSRTQIPLIGGWAITIHKSQGMTLDNVAATLGRCFAPGQAYVALSRARSLATMMVQNLPTPKNMIPDPDVKAFMDETFG